MDELAKNPPSGLGGTALNDTLIEIGSHVNLVRNAAVVVISDGGDNISHHSAAATASLFLNPAWPPVFGLILDYDESDKLRGYFKEISAATGGVVIYPSSGSKVPTATEELASVVSNSFTIRLESTQPTGEMAKLKLVVVGKDGKPRKDVNLLHVAEIPPCRSPNSSDR